MCLPLVFVFGAWVCAQTAFLEIKTDDGNLLYELALTRSSQWIMRWNHSVTGITVSDYYYWDGATLLLTDSHTPAFDAGLGHIPGRGVLQSDKERGYWITNINEPVPGNAYILRVGSSAVDHRIVHGNVSYSLSEVAANMRVRIEVVVR